MHQPESFMMSSSPKYGANAGDRLETEFFKEYTSPEALSKYTRATAGYGISYLLDHDYKEVYLRALDLLSDQAKKHGLRILEFGCGGGMNLLHLTSVLSRKGIRVEQAIGTDFSPVLIEAAQREARNFLGPDELRRLGFYPAKNENLLTDISLALKKERLQLEGAFDFIFGVNTIRYCHNSGKELDCVSDIFSLLVPGGVCV